MKKAEVRKPRKVVKPPGDADRFGDSGDIFSDLPAKPKGTKKKKSATTTPKDDIFAEEAAPGGLSRPLFVFYLFLVCLSFHSRLADVLIPNGTNEGFMSNGIVTFYGKIKCSQILTAQMSSNEVFKEENIRGP